MAITWSWLFTTDHTPAKLNAAGWGVNTGFAADNAYAWSFAGDAQSAIRAPFVETSYTDDLALPPVGPGPEGVVSVVLVSNALAWQVNADIMVLNWSGGSIYARWASTAASSAVKLYVDGFLVGTSSASLAAGTPATLSIAFDTTVDPWLGKLFINGVEEVAGSNAEAVESTAPAITLQACGGYSTYSGFAQIIIYDDYTDVPTVRYVSQMIPTGDDAGNTVGTWTITGGETTDWETLEPWVVAKYVTDATSTSGNRVALDTETDVATALGISPTIDAVTTHAVTSATAMKALIKVDSGSIAYGTASSSGQSYVTVTSGVTGASVIKVGFEVD